VSGLSTWLAGYATSPANEETETARRRQSTPIHCSEDLIDFLLVFMQNHEPFIDDDSIHFAENVGFIFAFKLFPCHLSFVIVFSFIIG
jgi:hypothetical protein